MLEDLKVVKVNTERERERDVGQIDDDLYFVKFNRIFLIFFYFFIIIKLKLFTKCSIRGIFISANIVKINSAS